MKSHPDELDLAAFASGDAGFFRRFGLERHVRGCEQCQDEVAALCEMRAELAGAELPELNWDVLASEMRANIHLGLEAGECVRVPSEKKIFSPRLAAAFASLVLLAGAALFMRDYRPRQIETATAPPVTPTPEYRIPVLESSMSGIEMRTGPNSFALLNREGGAVSQSVSAQGTMRSRDIDADTGSVTIKDVYLQ